MEALLAIGFALGVGMAVSFLALPLALLVTAASSVLLYLVGAACFERYSFYLSVTPSIAAALAAYVMVSGRVILGEQRQRQFLRRTFERYAAPEVVERMIQQPEEALAIYGERRELTVMFCDIRNFMRLAESLEVREVVGLLNLFFSRVDPIILAGGGTIDKYLGDSVMALFGALTYDPNHARNAVTTALEILKEIEVMQEEWRFAGAPSPLDVTIAIHSGPAVFGPVGSEKRIQYTAVGDVVNVASRLEQLGPEIGARMLLSEETYLRAQDLVQAEPAAEKELAGHTQPVRIFRVLGPARSSKPGEAPPQ